MQTQRYLYLNNPPILYATTLQSVPKTYLLHGFQFLNLFGSPRKFLSEVSGVLVFHFLAPTLSVFGGLSILICHTFELRFGCFYHHKLVLHI